MKRGRCLRCLTEDVELTNDHIVPKWLVKTVVKFGISMKGFSHNNTRPPITLKEKMCKKCNLEKGGNIEYNNPVVLTFVRDFLEELNKKVTAYETNNES